jgi:EmrB/QacA subfamily drug resistance transporter
VPVYGKLSDQLGRKPVLLVGLGLFLLGSLLCGLSRTAAFLIGCRTLQGLGAASIFSIAFSVIADIFPPHLRPKYQGVYSAVFGLASVIGPIAGGLIAQYLGWQWVFFLNLPIGLFAFFVVAFRMPAYQPAGTVARGRIDVLGAVLLVLGMAPLLIALSFGRSVITPGSPGFLWNSPTIRGLFALAGVALVTFLLVERRVRDPIVDFRLYADRVLGPTTAASFMVGASFLPGLVLLPLFMVRVVGVSTATAGIVLIPLSLAIAVGSGVSGRMGVRLQRTKPLLVGSLTVLVGGFAIMGFTLAPDASATGVALRTLIIGLGLGGTLPIFNIAVQNTVERQRLGAATSAVSFARSVGQVLGLAITTTLFTTTLAMPPRDAAVEERVTSASRSDVTSASASSPPTSGKRSSEESPDRVAPRPSPPALGEPTARDALTAATARLYRLSMAFALLSLLITLGTPDVVFGKLARQQAGATT